MKVPKPDEASKAYFDSLVPEDPRVQSRPMFGNRAAFVNGNMFLALFGSQAAVRLSEKDRAELLKQPGTSAFEPMPGRAMKEYVVLPRSVAEEAQGCRGMGRTLIRLGERAAAEEEVSRPLKVGVQLPEVERVVTWPELLDMARAAEQVGFDSIWVGDHLLFRDAGMPARGPWEAWSLLAALAAVTQRVELGPLVASTSFHNPALLAKAAATIDEISGGRLILGLGAGWNEVEYRAFGFPFDHRAERFEEAFTIIRGLLREGYVDFAGRYHEARDCLLLPPPARAGGPPIMVGTTGPRMLRQAAAHADAWNSWFTWFGNRPEGIAALREKVDAACVAVGRDPGTLERTVAVLVQVEGEDVARRGGPEERAPALRGSAEDLADSLRAFAAEGISHVQLVIDPIATTSIERLAPVLDLLAR